MPSSHGFSSSAHSYSPFSPYLCLSISSVPFLPGPVSQPFQSVSRECQNPPAIQPVRTPQTQSWLPPCGKFFQT